MYVTTLKYVVTKLNVDLAANLNGYIIIASFNPLLLH